MTDFAEGDKVILIDHDDCNDDWSDVRGTVMEMSPSTARGQYIRIKPVTDRPDGFKLTPFFWERDLVIKEEW